MSTHATGNVLRSVPGCRWRLCVLQPAQVRLCWRHARVHLCEQLMPFPSRRRGAFLLLRPRQRWVRVRVRSKRVPTSSCIHPARSSFASGDSETLSWAHDRVHGAEGAAGPRTIEYTGLRASIRSASSGSVGIHLPWPERLTNCQNDASPPLLGQYHRHWTSLVTLVTGERGLGCTYRHLDHHQQPA